MENLIIKATNISPAFNFLVEGKLSIEGKVITENAVITFEPIFKWIESFTGDKIELDIKLEYMNTSASMQLYSLLNKIDEKDAIKKITVNWYYDEDDEEHLDTGELFEDRLERTEFNFIVIVEEKGIAKEI